MNKVTQSKERRQAPRVILKRVITYQPGTLPKRGYLLPGKPFRGFLLNISNGGLCFKTRHRLQTKIVLKVSLPVNEISPVAPTLAQVAWVKRDPKVKEYRAGLKFII
jgi:c-di-GMP-binding flagellar brake protein YcgR